uniref:Uncharacterized protein n=2 Tax=Meloidogyne TaxID=189290 RepID=A0A6V7WD06_MELEN|nr:unnamed protein product [Meloidogyne enterolobii]CAD2184876.1 unnamed protein product [Meloidogyne enterolobii]
MFSFSNKMFLFFLSTFILFQLNNGKTNNSVDGCTGESCGSKQKCSGKGEDCEGVLPCCYKLKCDEENWLCADCPPLGAPCSENSDCCAGQSCQNKQCHTCYDKGKACDPRKNNCCDGHKCGRDKKCH